MARRTAINVGLMCVALLLAWSISLESGRIAEGDGLGYDGIEYAAMVIRRFDEGGPTQRLRPLVLALNQVVYDGVFHDAENNDQARRTQDVIRTFRAMNVVWAALLALVLCAILDQYAVPPVHKLIFIVNAFATVAVVKMFMFDPVLIDLGAYFWISLAVYAIIRGGRTLILVTTILAVLSREFGLLVALAGIHRDLRRRVPLVNTALTYLPCIVVFVAMRQWILATSDRVNVALTWLDVLGNLSYLLSPVFLVFCAYFTLTVFGGLSVLLFCRGLRGRLPLRQEPEWMTLAGAVFLVTLLGSLDIWRYLAYALPAVAILYAQGFRHDDWRLILPWTSAITVITQRPWGALTEESYFTDWFPLYLPALGIPDPPTPEFWAVWGFRFAIVAGLTAAVWVVQRPSPVSSPQVASSGG